MKVKVVGDINSLPKSTGRFWVSNHVSWLDIFAINSVQPMRFVGKDDIQAWPVIGWLVARSDTIFISRSNRNAALAANDIISEKGLKAQVVSVPSIGLFLNQVAGYRNEEKEAFDHYHHKCNN